MVGPMVGPSRLVVRFQGRQVAELCPGDPPFTFGRGDDRTLRFGHGCGDGGLDLDISRHVGSIHYDGGLWMVCNDSEDRPFDVIVGGVSNPLPPRSAPDSGSVWAVWPPGLDIKISAPSGRYVLSISLDAAAPPIVDPPERGDITVPLRKPTGNDRLLLAAKFLALPNPGDAVGNREAAEYASAARPNDEPVTAKAVEDCVGRWRRNLEGLGVTGIDGRDNINQLGRQLLAWGFLRKEDRKLLHPYGGR
ncbi:MAG: hypothetical protein ACRDTH_00045 [Pseudonocardiaceae bacterium]